MTQKIFRRKTYSRESQLAGGGLAAKVALVTSSVKKNKLPKMKPGDQVKVHARIKEGSKERIQIFEGIIIKDKNTAEGGSFTVRKMSHGVGVERVFMRNSPKVAKVEVVYPGKVRRAKLYYLRKLKGKAAKIDRDIEMGEAASKSAAAAKAASAGEKSKTESSPKQK